MEFGIHLPVIETARTRAVRMRDVVEYAVAAERLGYTIVGANDHIASRTGWLDGPTILAAVAGATERIQLATTILLPALRHPAVVAKTYATLDDLSDGRVILGVGAGVLEDDFRLLGIPFAERWSRLDESIPVIRELWREGSPSYEGRHYRLDGVGIKPLPARVGGPPIWVGSWGSSAGLRRAARLGDGWIASGFNTTPERFAVSWQRLQEELARCGREPSGFANALVSMYAHVTDDRGEAARVAREILAPALGRPAEDMLGTGLLGPADASAETLRRYAEAGAQRVLIWPVIDHRRQVELFAERVMPLTSGR